jgi:hypothetical protein
MGRDERPFAAIDRLGRAAIEALATDDRPLNEVPMAELCPGAKALEAINRRLR